MDYLSAGEAKQYLLTLCEEPVPATTAETICRRGNGNPLFLSAIVEELRHSCHSDVDTIVPDTLRQMFEQQTALLTDREQLLLRAAALAGATFSISCIAKVLQWEESDAETVCDALVRHHRILKAHMASEDGLERQTFVHVLYRDATRMTVRAGRRKSPSDGNCPGREE